MRVALGQGLDDLLRRVSGFEQPPGELQHAVVRMRLHRDDAAAALHHVARLRLGGIWNAVDDCPVRRTDLAEAIRNGSPLPNAGGDSTVTDQATGKRVANTKLRAAGWMPRYPTFREGLRALLPAR